MVLSQYPSYYPIFFLRVLFALFQIFIIFTFSIVHIIHSSLKVKDTIS